MVELTWVLAVGVASLVLGYFICYYRDARAGRDANRRKQQILGEARQQAEQIKREMEVQARQELINLREGFEREIQETRKELRQGERRLDKREDVLDKKQEALAKKEKLLETAEMSLAENRKELGVRQTELAALIQKETDELYRISGLSHEDARQVLLERIRREVEQDCEELINTRLARATETADQQAKEVVVQALQRCAAETTSEATVCSIALPNDDVKGRIIGREGRNIRSFEKATGVDVIVDDTPGVIVLSSFDSVRREAARLAMERLISDGRIHPGRIEEVTEKAMQEVQRIIAEAGKEASYEMGLGAIPGEVKMLLGRLKFRTSFGQNTLQHSIEVGRLAGMMAAELGLNELLAKRCGLLHDIGKALDHEHEGSHAHLGAQEARRYGEDAVVINAIESHHEEVPATSVYAGLIIAGDAMSASRPGARRETLERYIKRLERLEGLATRHEGVERAYAIQAGREIRVLVDSNTVNDKSAAKMSQDIAHEIEQELQYPGEIQVTVIREARFTEVAH
jgi:ribonuclease Y